MDYLVKSKDQWNCNWLDRYDLSGCPDWYEESWLKGNYPIPDSMKDGYVSNINGNKEETETETKLPEETEAASNDKTTTINGNDDDDNKANDENGKEKEEEIKS